VTTWCITGTLGWMPKTASSSSTEPALAPLASLVSTVGMSGTCLHGVTDEHEPALGAGDRALDEDEVPLGVGLHDEEVLGGDLLVAHAAGHAGAAEHARRGGAGADGAG